MVVGRRCGGDAHRDPHCVEVGITHDFYRTVAINYSAIECISMFAKENAHGGINGCKSAFFESPHCDGVSQPPSPNLSAYGIQIKQIGSAGVNTNGLRCIPYPCGCRTRLRGTVHNAHQQHDALYMHAKRDIQPCMYEGLQAQGWWARRVAHGAVLHRRRHRPAGHHKTVKRLCV